MGIALQEGRDFHGTDDTRDRAAILLVVGILASWLPARRASAVDPMRSMRVE